MTGVWPPGGTKIPQHMITSSPCLEYMLWTIE